MARKQTEKLPTLDAHPEYRAARQAKRDADRPASPG